MDKSKQLYFFIFLTTTLFTDINSIDDFPLNWFDAQNHCLSQGLTIDRDKSGQPYWTGVYRRLTPWIKTLGCYSDSIETQQVVMNKTMIISSVRMCQEICHHENIYKFAVKMNTCLCIESDIYGSPYNRFSASNCNIKCVVNSDDIYFEDCGGEGAYNIYETQGVYFNSVESCMALQCNPNDIKFIPQQCSKSLEKVCENMILPRNGYANSWSVSMKQCRESHPSTYLLGDLDLVYPYKVCERITQNLQLFWVGVARQKYTTIDQGWEVKKEQRETFLECQMCKNNDCLFRRCSDLLRGSIFCQNISNTSQSQITEHLTSLQGGYSASTFIPNSLKSTTGNHEGDLLLVTSASDDLVLKITLPLTVGLIFLLLCLVGLVLYKRRSKMTKTDRTKKADVKFVSKKKVYSELDFSESNPSFALEHCYQKISKGSNSLNDSPCTKQDGVNDYQRDRQTEGNIIYQNASTNITGDTSGYVTIAYNKKQEEESVYDHLRQDANET